MSDETAALVGELGKWRRARAALAKLTLLPLATKQETVYPELVRLTRAALEPATANYAAAEIYLDLVLGELTSDATLASRLFDAMPIAPSTRGDGIPYANLFRAFVRDARDPRGIRLVEFGNGQDWESAVVAVDGQSYADELVELLERPRQGLYFHGVGAGLYAGPRARSGLAALYAATYPTWQGHVAVGVALCRVPSDAAWFKSLRASGENANAKRLHIALTSESAKERIRAVDTITGTLSKPSFYGTRIGLCLVLEDAVPEVVERAALALATHAKSGQAGETSHHAVFLRMARSAALRGVTAEAREALEAVTRRIPRAPPLPNAAPIKGTLGSVPRKAPRPKPVLAASPHAPITANDDDIMRELLRSPDDDAPRLVLADRLLERGDPRGEFIQVQCALGRRIEGPSGRVPHLAGVPTDEQRLWIGSSFDILDPPNRAELEAREAELYKKHLRHWIAPVRAFIRTWSWRRGFLDAVSGPAAALLEGAATLLASHPVAVTLEKVDAAALAQLPHAPLHTLRSLTLSKAGARSVGAFLGENLSAIETLSLTKSPIGDGGVGRLAKESHLRALRLLDLRETGVGDVGLREIASSPVFERLTALALDDEGVTSAGLRALVTSKHLPHLSYLTLRSIKLEPELQAILTSRRAPRAG